MKSTFYSLGFIFLLIVFAIRVFQTSAWFRLDEKKYIEHYEKSTSLYSKYKLDENIDKFRRAEKFQFYFSLFLILLMVLSTFF